MLSLFMDNMLLHIENPIGSAKKLLNLINEFGNVAGCKVIFRNQWHFYKPIMNCQKEKLRKQFNLLLQQDNKIPSNKFS